jgi:hypothetical protein
MTIFGVSIENNTSMVNSTPMSITNETMTVDEVFDNSSRSPSTSTTSIISLRLKLAARNLFSNQSSVTSTVPSTTVDAGTIAGVIVGLVVGCCVLCCCIACCKKYCDCTPKGHWEETKVWVEH